MHAVFDTESKQRQDAGLAREKQIAQTRKWIADQQSSMVILDDTLDINPSNVVQQLGKTFFTNEFEVRLKKLCPSLLCETSSFNPSKKRLYHLRPEGRKFVCLFENGVMPEHSVMEAVEEDLLDPFVFDNPNKRIDRKDLPAFKQTTPTAADPLGTIEWKDGEKVRLPGTRRVKRAGREKTRGWRTVLIYLVWEGIVSPAQVEAIFGADDRAEWSAKLGKRKVATVL